MSSATEQRLDQHRDDDASSAAAAQISADHASANRRKRRREALSAYSFMTPWFIGLGLIVMGPMLASLYLSFTRYDLMTTPEWVGLENYVRLFAEDPRFWTSVRVTVLYSALAVPGILIFSLALAVFLNRGLRFLSAYRVLFYIPSLIGTSAAIAILWLQVFGGSGIVNSVLGLFGIDAPSWIGNPRYALLTLVVLGIWTFGSTMVIFLAGLRQIPDSYYEAAEIDGAGKWRQFRSITLPLLTPVIFFNGLLTVVNSLQIFTPAYVIDGPADSTLLYTVYLYQRAFVDFEMGYASALAWILLAALALIAGALFWSTRFWVHYGEES